MIFAEYIRETIENEEALKNSKIYVNDEEAINDKDVSEENKAANM